MKNFVIHRECGFLSTLYNLVLDRKLDVVFSEEIQNNSTTDLNSNAVGSLGLVYVCKVL